MPTIFGVVELHGWTTRSLLSNSPVIRSAAEVAMFGAPPAPSGLAGVFLGTTDVDDMYVGTSPVLKIYVGTTQVSP